MSAPGDLPDFVAAVGGSTAKLFQGFVSNVLANPLKVAQYGSVQVMLINLDNTSFLACEYLFFDSISGQFVDAGILSADANHSIANDGWPVWELPVRADTLYLQNGTAGAPVAIVIGRPETRRKGMAAAFYPRRLFQAVVPANTAANTGIELPGQDGNNPAPVLRDCSGYNGLVTMIIGASQAITGQVQYAYRDKSGARVFTDILNNPGPATPSFNIGHPYGFVTWRFFTTAAAPATPTTVLVYVVPAEGDG